MNISSARFGLMYEEPDYSLMLDDSNLEMILGKTLATRPKRSYVML